MTGLINQDDYIKTSIKFFIRKRYNQVDSLKKGGYEIEDIEQELHISIFAASTAYNPKRGAFSTFLKHVLNNTMSKLVEKQTAETRSMNIVFESCLNKDNFFQMETGESFTSKTLSQQQIDLQLDFNDFYRACSEKEQEFLKRSLVSTMMQTAKDMKMHRSTLYDLQNKICSKLKNAGFENYFH